MTIAHWPVAERPREKLLSKGPAALSDAELLAIFLRTGVRGKTALDIARELLKGFGGLRALLAADEKTLCTRPGLGPAKYAQLQASLEIARRYLGEGLQRGGTLTSVAETKSYLQAWLRDAPRELFCCLFLDNRHRVIAREELFAGTLNGAAVYPREVVRRALNYNAAAVVFVHNHPSGVAQPSNADKQLTYRLREALALIDVRILDHFIVGDGETLSFTELGLL